MDYCGVEYTAVEAVGSSSWKWRIFISNEVGMKISGEAVSQAAAIAQAHDAICESLRASGRS